MLSILTVESNSAKEVLCEFDKALRREVCRIEGGILVKMEYSIIIMFSLSHSHVSTVAKNGQTKHWR